MTSYIVLGGALGRIKKVEFTKLVVGFLLVHGVLWVDLSYGLAWKGVAQIAENLSKVALVEIVAVTLVYCLKSLFENLSKHNQWPDKKEGTTYDYQRNESEI